MAILSYNKTQASDKLYTDKRVMSDDSANFFLGKSVEIIKDEDDTDDVSGDEALLKAFTLFETTKPFENLDDVTVEGSESASGTIKRIVGNLINMIKDAARFIMDLINNKISRLGNRLANFEIERKRKGIKPNEVRYPHTTQRLIIPSIITSNPNFLVDSIEKVYTFYDMSIKVHEKLKGEIRKIKGENVQEEANVFLDGVIKLFKMTSGHIDNEHRYFTEVLPGNRKMYLLYPAVVSSPGNSANFIDATGYNKLDSASFTPTSSMIDNLTSSLNKLYTKIKEHHKAMSTLTREFEKEVFTYYKENDFKVISERKKLVEFLFGLDKKLNTLTIQYVYRSMDAGLDVCEACLNK